MVIHQYDVYLVPLDPARKLRKTRPCVVVSPDLVNRFVKTVLIAPLTSTDKGWPSRVDCRFQGHPGAVALEQVRCVDQVRLRKHLGRLDPSTQREISRVLVEMFS